MLYKIKAIHVQDHLPLGNVLAIFLTFANTCRPRLNGTKHVSHQIVGISANDGIPNVPLWYVGSNYLTFFIYS